MQQRGGSESGGRRQAGKLGRLEVQGGPVDLGYRRSRWCLEQGRLALLGLLGLVGRSPVSNEDSPKPPTHDADECSYTMK